MSAPCVAAASACAVPAVRKVVEPGVTNDGSDRPLLRCLLPAVRYNGVGLNEIAVSCVPASARAAHAARNVVEPGVTIYGPDDATRLRVPG